MFIVKKKIGNKDYYYLRKSERRGRKVKAVTVAYLGKTKKGAEKRAREIINNIRKGKGLKDEKGINEMNMKNDNLTNKVNKAVEKVSNEDKAQFSNDKSVKISIEELATYCKQKGFIFRSSDIYGGFAGFWDFGPLGVELFSNLKNDFWKNFVISREDIVGMEASIISHPRVWKASGHLDEFKDIAVICKKCENSTKLDLNELGKVKCDKCGGEYEEKGAFNLLFKTEVGALDTKEAYLRGETAQNMFTNFKLIKETSRKNLPFGIAQIGRCFRNEIAPRDFLFRSREFHIGEFEYFINPEEIKCKILDNKLRSVKFKFLDKETQKEGKDDLRDVSIRELVDENKLDEWHAYWLAQQILWFRKIGLEEIKVREHTKDELSHYSSATFDVDYQYGFGSKEVAGIANRGQFDLKQHEKESKEKMEVFDEMSGKKVIPRVIEPTFGMERIFLALLTKAYKYDEERGNIVLSLPANLVPVKCAVFPIVKKEEFEKLGREIYDNLKLEWNIVYDKSGSIGRRYARQDEIGTPYCITIDGGSLNDKSVTVRLRDTAEQIRIKVKDLKEAVRAGIMGEDIRKFGKIVETRKK